MFHTTNAVEATLYVFAMHKMQSFFVVLHFVNDIYFSVSFIFVLLCSERKITLNEK